MGDLTAKLESESREKFLEYVKSGDVHLEDRSDEDIYFFVDAMFDIGIVGVYNRKEWYVRLNRLEKDRAECIENSGMEIDGCVKEFLEDYDIECIEYLEFNDPTIGYEYGRVKGFFSYGIAIDMLRKIVDICNKDRYSSAKFKSKVGAAVYVAHHMKGTEQYVVSSKHPGHKNSSVGLIAKALGISHGTVTYNAKRIIKEYGIECEGELSV
jgi:hypothetical protein